MWPARRLAVEAGATFGLVLLGTGACVVEAITGRLGVVGVGLCWGGAVWLLAARTGAHMNPAVTLASRLPARETISYALAQTAGALAASLLLLALFRERAGTLGATAPKAGIAASFALEFVMTFALVFAVLRLPGPRVAAAAGAIVAVEAILAGPLTGASMNPARSLAPALVSGSLGGLWIYLLAPSLGGLAAAYAP
jgi:aquaporin Z